MNSHCFARIVDSNWQKSESDVEFLAYVKTSPSWMQNHKNLLEQSQFHRINLGIDPYGSGLWQSHLFKSHLYKEHFDLAKTRGAKIFRISTLPYKVAGSSVEQDLAIILSSVLQLFRDYEGEIAISQIVESLSFELALGSNLFESLNFIESFKLLMLRLLELYEVEVNQIPDFYTVPDVRQLSCREPWNNILRLTSMHSASMMGGSLGHVSLPFDLFSEGEGMRVTRNISEILRRESHLTRVGNPVEGSFYSSEKTSELCEKAWSLCGEIENKEGLKSSLRSGWLYTQVYESQNRQTQAFLQRDIKMTGVNQYVLKSSLSTEFPLVEKSETQTLENWWAQWMDLGEASTLCQVERFVPHSLVDCFEKWQFKGDEWNKKRGEGHEIPVLVESKEIKNKKWSKVKDLFSLAALTVKEMSLDELRDEPPMLLVLAGDPQGDFVKNLFKKTPEKIHSRFVWCGEKKIEPFAMCLNQNQHLDEFFHYVFKNLEAAL